MNFDPYVARIVPDSVIRNKMLKGKQVIAYNRSDAVQWEVAYLFTVTDLVPTIAIYRFDGGTLLFFSNIEQYEFDILNAFGVSHLNSDDIQRRFHLARPQYQYRDDGSSMNWNGNEKEPSLALRCGVKS